MAVVTGSGIRVRGCCAGAGSPGRRSLPILEAARRLGTRLEGSRTGLNAVLAWGGTKGNSFPSNDLSMSSSFEFSISNAWLSIPHRHTVVTSTAPSGRHHADSLKKNWGSFCSNDPSTLSSGPAGLLSGTIGNTSVPFSLFCSPMTHNVLARSARARAITSRWTSEVPS